MTKMRSWYTIERIYLEAWQSKTIEIRVDFKKNSKLTSVKFGLEMQTIY